MNENEFDTMPIEQKENFLGKNQKFTRIRRVTGYLSGDVCRWGNSKQAELADRVKHTQRY